jgi:hypothetical protein
VALLALVGTQLGQTLKTGGASRPVVVTSLASAALLATIVQTPGVSQFFGCRPLGPLNWATAIGASTAATLMSDKVEATVRDPNRLLSLAPARLRSFALARLGGEKPQ